MSSNLRDEGEYFVRTLFSCPELQVLRYTFEKGFWFSDTSQKIHIDI